MNDNAPYDRLTAKEKVARNSAESAALIFKMGGPMTAANKLGYTDAWLRKKLGDKTIRGSETLVSMLRALLAQPKAL